MLKSLGQISGPTLLLVLMLAGLSFVGGASAAEVERRGEAYVVYLPGSLDYFEVLERVKAEVLAANWDITNVQDIDLGMRQYGLSMQNKVVSVCKSQLLAQALKEDPFISLVVPCRFTVLREAGADGRIVVGFVDPVAEAKAIGIANYGAAQTATDDLKGVLKTLAEFYSGK